MPRLPTIRVIGSHDISTRFPDGVRASFSGMVTVAIARLLISVWLRPGVGRGPISGGQLGAPVPPLRLLVERVGGEVAQGADDAAVHPDGRRGEACTRGFVHERHELVGEPGHRAADADAADV